MFDWILKAPLKAPIKASVNLTFLALAATWLNIQKRSSSVVLQDFNFYLNKYLLKKIHEFENLLLLPRQNNDV